MINTGGILRNSYKNLRWEEAHLIFITRNNLSLDFDEFADKVIENEMFNIDSFDDICKQVRLFDRGSTNSLNEEEQRILLKKFGAVTQQVEC